MNERIVSTESKKNRLAIMIKAWAIDKNQDIWNGFMGEEYKPVTSEEVLELVDLIIEMEDCLCV
jgi:hypothetical protein